MCDHICRGRSDRKLQFYNRKSGFALPQKYYVMSSCYHIISFAFACDHKRRGRSDRKWQFYSRKNGFALPQKMSSRHHVIMSSCHHVIMSSCHHVIMSSCHHVITSSRHHVIMSSCHHVIMFALKCYLTTCTIHAKINYYKLD